MWKPRLLYLVGCWVLVISILQLLPLLYAVFLGEKASVHSFFSSVCSSALVGGSLVLGFRSTEKIRFRKLTVLLPVVGLCAMAFWAGLPFFFLMPGEGIFPAIYDGMSLITTTGTSAYDDHPNIDNLKAMLLWRAIASWAGGYLAICLSLSIFSAMNVGGLQLHNSPMPFGDSEVGYARLKATSLALYPVYIVVTLFCALFLWLTGAGDILQSVQMAMVTISTAGISDVYGNAVDMLGPQIVIGVFLIISMMNWDIHYVRMIKAKLRHSREPEYQSLLLMIAIGAVFLVMALGTTHITAIWQGVFATISAASTSGILPRDILDQEHILPISIILLTLAMVGGASMSATGGLKQLRAIMIYKTGKAEIERLAHPHVVTGMQYDAVKVRQRDIEAVWLLLGSFIFIAVVGGMLLAIYGVSLQDALILSFTSITLSGPLVFVANPFFGGYGGLTDVDYSILTVLMLIGRIEASIFIALFLRALWRG